MKKYPFLESLGSADGRFVEEVLEYNTAERRIFMKKKIIAIALAAALAVTAGISAVAANVGGLEKLGEFFDRTREAIDTPEEFPTVDVTAVGADETVSAEPDVSEPLKPGEARLTSAFTTNHGFYGTIEWNLEGMGLPDSLPEDALENHGYNVGAVSLYREVDGERQRCVFGGQIGTTRNGDIIEIVIDANGVEKSLEGNLIIEIDSLDYTAYEVDDKVAVPLYEGKAEIEVNADDYPKLESRYSVNKPLGEDGKALTLELCPSGIEIRNEDGECSGIDLLESVIELRMNDGTTVRGRIRDYSTHELIFAFGTSNYVGFATPLDVDSVESVSVDGVEFTF